MRLFVLILLLGGFMPFAHAAPPDTVILLSLDTLRPDYLGTGGIPEGVSPVLDQLSRQSLAFPEATAGSPWTIPGHVSALSGLAPYRHRVTMLERTGGASFPVLPELLRKEGFRTAGFVTTYLLSQQFNFNRGFEVFEEVPGDTPWSEAIRRGENWLAEHRGEKRFLFLHLYTVHQPYNPPEPFRTLFPIAGPFRKELETMIMPSAMEALPAADLPYLRQRYLGEIRQMDAMLGGLFRGLDQNRTVTVIMSDHGEAFGEHDSAGHQKTLYEELLRCVLLFHAPGRLKPELRAEPAALWDILPTALGLLSLNSPGDLTGRDLRKPGQARPMPGDTELPDRHFISLHEPASVEEKLIVEQRHVEEAFETFRYRLFNLATDPGELNDLADRQPTRVKALRDEIRAIYGERWPRLPSGWCIQLTAGDTPQTFQLVLESSGGFLGVEEIHPEKTVGKVTSFAPSKLAGNQRGPALTTMPKKLIRFERTLRNETLVVRVAPKQAGATFSVGMGINDSPAPPDRIFLGAAGRHPDGFRFTLKAGQKDLERAGSLPFPDRTGFTVWWQPGIDLASKEAATPVPPLDEATRERLRSLGYVR